MSLYASDWKPRGIRKDWERCSMSNDSTERFLGGWAKDVSVRDAVAWFDDDGSARVVVADLSNEKRITVRIRKNGEWRITFAGPVQ